MGDYYGYGNGGSGGGSSGGAPTPNFSVPPPNFSKGPNYQNQNSQQNSYGPPPPQGNWGPNQSRNDDSSGYGSGNYNNQGRNNQGNRGGGGGGAGNFGNSQRNESGYNDRKNNFSGGSVNKSGYNKGGYDSSNDNMIIQEDTIFVSGMSSQTTEEDIACHFGAIGIIKKDKKTMKPKIWLYRNKETGESKGEATITYDDSNAAKSAISWFDNKDFNGANIHVSLAQRQNNWQKGGNFRSNPRGGGGAGGPPGGNRDGGSGGNRGGFNRDHSASGARNDDRRSQGISGGGGGGGGGFGRNQRDGDWTCSSCNNTNFAWRNECNRCKEPKSGAGGGMTGGGSGNSSFRQGGAGGPPRGGNSNFNRRDQGPMRGAGDRGNDRNRPY
ncbi:RNA-binding protein cabeza isoform X2 [Contarinia nasturtii]|uniref:RNA-binding protein cabeza isoform X2 n=1 Tax=Contarinia nasturtii TaxID=265458 RepID=UPI0012D377BD|nr:RNA-binding protein cabeza isoform X2 [Contarinia nasturtii]